MLPMGNELDLLSSEDEYMPEISQFKQKTHNLRATSAKLAGARRQEDNQFDVVESALKDVAYLTNEILSHPEPDSDDHHDLVIQLNYRAMKIRQAKNYLDDKVKIFANAQADSNLQRAYKIQME